MYSLLYWLYFSSGYASGKHTGRLIRFIFRLSSWLCFHYCNDFLVKTFRQSLCRRAGVTRKKRKQKIIASLTSYSARIDTAWIAVETILRQRVKADEVVLWLAQNEFPQGRASLPLKLLAQTGRGLTVRFCDDLRSHKKYFYTLKEYPEAILILFDDDMFYPKNLIKKLLALHKKVPDNIICSSSSSFRQENFFRPITWEPNREEITDVRHLCVNSGSGTLLPPGTLHENVFDVKTMKLLALQTDDLWLTAAAYMQGTKLSSLRYRPFPIAIRGTQKECLYHSNNFEASKINNNTQWRSILKHYKKELSEWQKQLGIRDAADNAMEADSMKSNMKLSVVITVYNLEDYIGRCFESVSSSGNKAVEVIVVDDGSADNSPRLCDGYEKMYPNVRVIHQNNCGASAARNTGIRNASGDYIMFIDGDDFLTEGAIDIIVSELDGETELFTFNYYEYYGDGKERKEVRHLDQAALYDGKGKITKALFYSVPALPMPWLYILKHEFLVEHRLYMITGLLDEDEEWSARLFAGVKKVKVIDFFAYQYLKDRADSLSHNRRPDKIMADLDIISLLVKESGKACYDKRQKHILHNKCRELMMKIIREKSSQPRKVRRLIDESLKKCRRLLLGGSLKEKNLYFLSCILGWEKAERLLKKAARLKSCK